MNLLNTLKQIGAPNFICENGDTYIIQVIGPNQFSIDLGVNFVTQEWEFLICSETQLIKLFGEKQIKQFLHNQLANEI